MSSETKLSARVEIGFDIEGHAFAKEVVSGVVNIKHTMGLVTFLDDKDGIIFACSDRYFVYARRLED